MIDIRLAETNDTTAIADIYRPFVEDGWASFESIAPKPADIANRISQAGAYYPWLVAVRENDVLGYAYASQHRSREAYRTSVDTTVYCADNARGQGVGTKLYSKLLDVLTQQNYVSAYAGIALPNEGSIALHSKVGFSLIGTYPNVGFKQGAWRDTQWWHRPLAEPCKPPLPISTYSNLL